MSVPPKTIKIMGQRFRVHLRQEPLVEEIGIVQGYMSSHKGEIIIRESRPELEVDTLIHEILHAIEYKMGLTHNEHYVNRFATGLTAVFHDNPKVLEYIAQRIKEEK